MSNPLTVLDCEVYRNYFLAKVRRMDTGATRVFEQYEGHPLDTVALRSTLSRITSVTFNGRNYDMPIIGLALTGATCEAIKRCSDFIIAGNMRPWDVERQFNFRTPDFDHIDLIAVAPGMVSLKVYAGRLHVQRMQDLPIEHDALIEPEQRSIILDYNDNDLTATEALYWKFKKQLDLRVQMSREYGVDLRSKSDAQIAEAIIRKRLTDQGVEVRKAEVRARAFKFRFPNFLRNAGPIVQGLIDLVREADFVVDPGGYVKMPEQLAKAKIKIGNSVYRLGIGGLHSSEKSQAVVADDEHVVIDSDVASYYPSIILKTKLFPRHLGESFLQIYQKLYDERIAAKRRAAELKKRIAEIERTLREAGEEIPPAR